MTPENRLVLGDELNFNGSWTDVALIELTASFGVEINRRDFGYWQLSTKLELIVDVNRSAVLASRLEAETRMS